MRLLLAMIIILALAGPAMSTPGGVASVGGNYAFGNISGNGGTATAGKTGDKVRFTGSGGTTVNINSANKTVTISAPNLSNVTNDTQTKASVVPNTAPSAGQILVGNAGGTAYAPQGMSGDVTITSSGVASLKSTGTAGTYTKVTTDAQGRVTNGATMSTSDLSDYSTGTWTPTVTFATPGDLSVVYSGQAGRYIKIGNLVMLNGYLQTSTFTYTTASGVLTVGGLPPFASDATTNNYSLGNLFFRGITKAGYTQFLTRIAPNASVINIIAAGSGATPTNVTTADVPSGSTVLLEFTIFYQSQ